MKALSVLTVLIVLAISSYFRGNSSQVSENVEDTVDSTMSAPEHRSDIPL